jgi:hypothetical protein
MTPSPGPAGRWSKDVRYANFKNAVEAQQGEERAKVYHEVWSAVSALETLKIPGPSARAGEFLSPWGSACLISLKWLKVKQPHYRGGERG